jgi:tetratricopeptide (TPR) repeat protein
MFLPMLLLASEEDIWFAKAEHAMEKQNYTKAIEYYNKIIKKDNSNAKAYYNRGMAYLMWQKFEEAMNDFNKTIKIDSNYTDAYNNRGYLYYLVGENGLALEDFNRAIKLDSNFAEAYLNRGANYIDMNLYEPAKKDLNKAISFNPDNPSPYLELGRLYYRTKKYGKSVESYTKCISLNLVNPKIYYNRANSYFKMGKYEKAIADYTQTLKMDSTDFDALNNRAVSYDKLGKKELAEKDRKTLLTRTGTKDLFLPLDKIEYIQTSDSSNSFSFLIPKHWYKKENHTEFSDDVVISPEKLKDFNSPYSIGIRMSYNGNMGKQFNISNRDSLLEFWEGSMGKNAEKYFSYRIESRKKFARVGRHGRLNKSIVQFTETSYPLYFYEFALAERNIIFYAFFQAPLKQIDYFEKIFDKIVDSIRLIPKGEKK